ncbi:MAG: PepSY domain-containing protein [Nitrococcus sp.]|nr:PepSY domain-containing protein [Nitrococcus sp.]
MTLKPIRYTLPWVVLALAISTPALADELTEQKISMQDLPPAVAKTMQSELGNKKIDELEKISYEGIVVLYEAEHYQDGEEYEVYVYPNGEIAAHHSHKQGHEQEEEGRW